MPSVTLTRKEISILQQWIRRQSPVETIQDLLQTLDSLLDAKSGRIDLSDDLLDKIQTCAFKMKNPVCSATLLAVFQRTLGKNLGKVL
jgi:hypothetical protein